MRQCAGSCAIRNEQLHVLRGAEMLGRMMGIWGQKRQNALSNSGAWRKGRLSTAAAKS